MGQFDAIADKAAEKTGSQQGNVAVTPPQPNNEPSQSAQQAMGVANGQVPQPSQTGNIETAPMPATAPAAKVIGLGETDVAPGGPPVVSPAPVPTPQQVAPKPPMYAKTPEVAQAGMVAAQADQAKSGPGTPVAEQSDPVKSAAKEPGFWDKLISAAKGTGRTLFELLGDFTAGYSHQQSTPTQDRLAREQQLRLQGNAAQTQKDLQQMQQGFQDAQNKLQREHEDALAKITDERERAIAKQNFDIQERQLKIEQERNYLSYQLEGLTRMFGYGQQGAALTQPGALDKQFGGG